TDLEYLNACRAEESERTKRQRRTIGRAFVKPVEHALSRGFDDQALRLMAAGAVLADDPDFTLIPELWAAGAGVVGEMRARCGLGGGTGTARERRPFPPGGGRGGTRL